MLAGGLNPRSPSGAHPRRVATAQNLRDPKPHERSLRDGNTVTRRPGVKTNMSSRSATVRRMDSLPEKV